MVKKRSAGSMSGDRPKKKQKTNEHEGGGAASIGYMTSLSLWWKRWKHPVVPGETLSGLLPYDLISTSESATSIGSFLSPNDETRLGSTSRGMREKVARSREGRECVLWVHRRPTQIAYKTEGEDYVSLDPNDCCKRRLRNDP